jgi:hypothetical protein
VGAITIRIGEVIENSYRVAPFGGGGTPITQISDFFVVKPFFVLLDPY